MDEEQNLVLILARGLASAIATPMVLADPDGAIVYYNEPAEQLLGTTFAETGAMPRDRWVELFYPKDPDSGEQVRPSALPLIVALEERKPAHRPLTIQAGDGQTRTIAVTAFPLWARTDEFVGAGAIFWEAQG